MKGWRPFLPATPPALYRWSRAFRSWRRCDRNARHAPYGICSMDQSFLPFLSTRVCRSCHSQNHKLAHAEASCRGLGVFRLKGSRNEHATTAERDLRFSTTTFIPTIRMSKFVLCGSESFQIKHQPVMSLTRTFHPSIRYLRCSQLRSLHLY